MGLFDSVVPRRNITWDTTSKILQWRQCQCLNLYGNIRTENLRETVFA
jgi:hypothetical protein